MSRNMPEAACQGCFKTFRLAKGYNHHKGRCTEFAAYSARIRQEAREEQAMVLEKERESKERATLDSTLSHLDDNDAQMSVDHTQSVPIPPAEPPPIFYVSGRRGRPRILPRRYRHPDPPPTEPSAPTPENNEAAEAIVGDDNDIAPRFQLHRSELNQFGLFHIRKDFCAHLPPDIAVPSNVADLPNGVETADAEPEHPPSPYGPHPNWSTFALNNWFWNGNSQKTVEDLINLQKLLLDDKFVTEDLREVNFRRINEKLASGDFNYYFSQDAGWKHTKLTIPVPLGCLSDSAPNMATFEVDDFYYRSLTSIIHSTFSSPTQSKNFCYEPYEMRVKPPTGGPDMAVYGELFWSSEFRKAHEEIQHLPRAEGDTLPRAVAALQFWLDGMAATNFGTAKIWPAYLQFGNQSKYERGKPCSGNLHHFAHIPSLPSTFQDFVQCGTGVKAPDDLQTHCRRKIMQSAWKVLLDPDFVHAWQHGIVVKCGDGVTRRMYPRIFTYAADYPEKVLLAGIKHLGKHPCPRCLVHTKDIHKLGLRSDTRTRTKLLRLDDVSRRYNVNRARQFIFDERLRVNHNRVNAILDDRSQTPVENAFSMRLGDLGFDFHNMLVVDVLHEWEVGVWKQIFTHLIRILDSYRTDKVQKLDQRVRAIRSFGTASRNYSGNISEMKQMTAYSFETLLQCSLPVFEGLLPQEYDDVVQDLIYLAASVHALAKLRLHTDATLASLVSMTEQFAKIMRTFKFVICPAHATVELPVEVQRRVRRTTVSQLPNDSPERVKTAITKQFNVSTSKVHALGDYALHIAKFGTTDSYTTGIGEAEHRRSKNNYKRTNKVNFVKQLTEIERRQENLLAIADHLSEASESEQATHTNDELNFLTAERTQDVNDIAKGGVPFVLGDWLFHNRHDPAIHNFLHNLEQHLVTRMKGSEENIEYSPAECAAVVIKENTIYEHKTLQAHYMTYDLRRKHDTVNPMSNTPDVMMLSPDGDTAQLRNGPFCYC